MNPLVMALLGRQQGGGLTPPGPGKPPALSAPPPSPYTQASGQMMPGGGYLPDYKGKLDPMMLQAFRQMLGAPQGHGA